MTYAEFVLLYPNLDTNYCTGGNCTAFYLPIGDEGAFALMTDAEGDPTAPLPTDTEVLLGFYDKNGDPRDDWSCGVSTWEEAEKLIDQAMGFKKED